MDTDISQFLDDAPRLKHNRVARKAAQRISRRQTKRPADQADPKHRFSPVVPKNDNQRDLIAALEENDQVFAVGPAGTGKTYLVARHAMRRLLDGRTQGICIARPTEAPKRHKLGFRPGTQNEKIADWLVPIMHAFQAEASKSTIDRLLKEGKIEFLAFETLRGRSLENRIVWCDESQNLPLADFKLFLTRIGEGSQVIITGDTEQSDIEDSGLDAILDMIEEQDLSPAIIEFDDEDVVRSETAREWVMAFRAASL